MAGLDAVQLHGQECPELAGRLDLPCFKVLHVPAGSLDANSLDALEMQARAWAGRACMLLLDTQVEVEAEVEAVAVAGEGGTSSSAGSNDSSALDGKEPPSLPAGGSGRVFDWDLLQRLHVPVLVAGGLNADNARDALARAGAGGTLLGLDVSSGVESSPGVKDKTKLLTFLRTVKEYK